MGLVVLWFDDGRALLSHAMKLRRMYWDVLSGWGEGAADPITRYGWSLPHVPHASWSQALQQLTRVRATTDGRTEVGTMAGLETDVEELNPDHPKATHRGRDNHTSPGDSEE